MSEQEYIGLTKKNAQNKAERENLIFRLIRIDNEKFLDYPTDIRTDRICVEFDGGLVVKASLQ